MSQSNNPNDNRNKANQNKAAKVQQHNQQPNRDTNNATRDPHTIRDTTTIDTSKTTNRTIDKNRSSHS
jgi:hypothetical protein